MRRVKLEDLKKGAEIYWFENGRKYIIERVYIGHVKFRGFPPSDIQDVLSNCYIKENRGAALFGSEKLPGMTCGRWYAIKDITGDYFNVENDSGSTIQVKKDLFEVDIIVSELNTNNEDWVTSPLPNIYRLPSVKNGYPPMPSVKPPKENTLSEQYPHYYKDVSNLKVIDVYRMLELFEVNDPCIQHAIKKLLAIGNRGVKDHDRDFREIMDTLKRYEEMRSEDGK